MNLHRIIQSSNGDSVSEQLDPSRYELLRDFRRRSGLVIRLALALALCLLVTIGLAILNENYEVAAFLILVFGLALSCVWVLKKTKSPALSGNLLLSLVAFLILYTLFSVPGEVRAVHAWVAALPVVGTILGKRKSGFVWFVIASSALLLSAYMGSVLNADFPFEKQKVLVGHVSFVVLCIFLTYVSFVYESYNSESLSFIRNLGAKDALTKLFNRRGFISLAQHLVKWTRRSQKYFFIIFIDLDKFKPINDTYGHAEGDYVLKEFSNVLRASVRESDVIGRLGGDEFAIAGSLSEPSQIERIVRRLETNLENERQKSGKPYRIHFSYGIAFDEPAKSVTLSELIVKADDAMYREKRIHSAA